MSVGDLSSDVSLHLVNRLVYGFLDKHLVDRNKKTFDEILMNDLIVRF